MPCDYQNPHFPLSLGGPETEYDALLSPPPASTLGETGSGTWAGRTSNAGNPSYVVPWTEISFNDVYSSDFRFRTTLFSGVTVAGEEVGRSTAFSLLSTNTTPPSTVAVLYDFKERAKRGIRGHHSVTSRTSSRANEAASAYLARGNKSVCQIRIHSLELTACEP